MLSIPYQWSVHTRGKFSLVPFTAQRGGRNPPNKGGLIANTDSHVNPFHQKEQGLEIYKCHMQRYTNNNIAQVIVCKPRTQRHVQLMLIIEYSVDLITHTDTQLYIYTYNYQARP